MNFIKRIIDDDIFNGLCKKKLKFRFPPEPNGYLHIGHAKAIFINYNLSKTYNAELILRFDDTNPMNEKLKFINSIKEDINWLNVKYNHENYTSKYFSTLYKWAIELIIQEKAYVDDQNQQVINLQRKNPHEPGILSPYRNRSIDENLLLFKNMKLGKFKKGSCVLRAKINMNSPNMNLRDPVMYRIIFNKATKFKKCWLIFPTYDWAHGQSDLIENISHSLCSTEFENHKDLYNWYLDQISNIKNINISIKPKQIEFSRLNITYNVMSKRILKSLIDKKIILGWDDPRILTLQGLRRKGYPSKSIENFCNKIGISKRDNLIDISLLEYFARDILNKISYRVMVVVDPIEIVIDNYSSHKTEILNIVNNPENINYGFRPVIFSKHIYIEKSDFMANENTVNFFGLKIGGMVRLNGAYVIKAVKINKDFNGVINKIHCLYYKETKSGLQTKTTKYTTKRTIHWVSCNNCISVKINLYDNLFTEKNPSKIIFNLYNNKNVINKNSIKQIQGYAEISLKCWQNIVKRYYQFQRLGYFYLDTKDSSKHNLVFNRTVGLRNYKKNSYEQK